jgi:hypothetical protein
MYQPVQLQTRCAPAAADFLVKTSYFVLRLSPKPSAFDCPKSTTVAERPNGVLHGFASARTPEF